MISFTIIKWKLFFLLPFAILLPELLFAQNDNCDASRVINTEGTINETNTAQSEYWYSYQTPNDAQNRDITVSAPGTTVSIFNDPCFLNDLIVASAPGFGEATATDIAAGDVVYIRIEVQSDLTSFDLSTAISTGGGGGSGPINNICDDAIAINTTGTQIVTDTQEAEYWYQFIMPAVQSTLQLSSDPGANIDVTVYTGADCNNLTIAAQGTSASVLDVTTLTANEVVWIKWGAQLGTTGSFVLETLPTGGGGGGGTITDITLSSLSIDEIISAFTVVGDLSTNLGDAFTFTLVSGVGSDDNNSFDIITGAGRQLVITESPDFETKSSYSIRIKVDDGIGGTFEKAFTITVNDLTEGPNSAPTNITLSPTSIDENVAANSVVGTLTTTDADTGDSFFYELVAGAGDTDNASFFILPFSDQLEITVSPDFEMKPSYSVRIQTDDGNGGTFAKAFTISINDLPEGGNTAPNNISLSATAIDENVAANSTVGTFSSTDANTGDTFTYTLVAGTGDTDNGAFNINGNSLRITNSPDFETKSSYSVRIRTTDQGSLSFEKQFSITINDQSNLAQSIVFNAVGNKTYGDAPVVLEATASSGLALSYQVVEGPGSINGNELTLTGAGTLVLRALQAGNSDYAAASEDQTIIVAAKALTISGLSAENKVYDGTTTATLSGTVTLVGVLGTDNVILSGTPVAAFADANAETDKSITVSGYTLSGAESANYSLTQPTGLTANINKAEQTITFNTITIEVDIISAAFALGASSSSTLPISYTANPSGTITIDANGNAIPRGGIPGIVEIIASQAGNNNYNAATSVSQSLCIMPLTPVVTTQTQNGVEILTTSGVLGLFWYREGTPAPTQLSTGSTLNPSNFTPVIGVYYAIVDAGGGCMSKPSNKFKVDIVTGLEDLSQVASIWPNPATDYLFVDKVSAEAVGIVVQMNGSVLEAPSHYANGSLKINISTLVPGVYLLKVVDKSSIRIARFIKD